jgi:arylsulfatase A-like enzyme
MPFLALSAWCGLLSGLLEVGAIIVRTQVFDLNRLYWISRHFVWLIPLLNLVIFLVLGLFLSVVTVWAPRRGRWLAGRLLGALTVLPPIWAAFPRIFGPAGFLLALGVSARMVPALERHPAGFRRLVRVSFPIVAGLVLIAAASLWVQDRIRAWREAGRPLPSTGSPNVLLIVLDTVGAEHLSLYGYDRPTSPSLEELASRGINFDRVQAASSWTLPSHASMFTGRWPHELSAGWFTPLDGKHPTLAEYLSSRGYATAGFVANSWYCATDSGLARGFTEYRDYRFSRLTAFTTAVLVDRPLEGLKSIASSLESWLGVDVLAPVMDEIWWLFKKHRKRAADVNREFLDWLANRRQPERPFFAFLNYYDAHYPYEISKKGVHRFGAKPLNRGESAVINNWLKLAQTGPTPRQIQFARDSYDDCVADQDEQIGCLLDELAGRSLLERTWVIVTGDHGESFGEQPGIYWHGTSLYQAQLHVPLVIVPPAAGPAPRRVQHATSLRDVPATIVDILGLQSGSPFPGTTLARFWKGAPSSASDHAANAEPVLSEVVPLTSFDPDPGQWVQKPRWPSAALTDDEWSYIRHEESAREELFRVREDAGERHDLAANPAMKPVLERLRQSLSQLTAGPLTPQRFKP